MASQKTEALFMRRRRRGAPPAEALGDQIKYLGLLGFSGPFESLAFRAESVAVSLSRLLINLGGPDGRVCRLYANIVRAVTLDRRCGRTP
ncbi:hypothetical protein ACFW04_011814 [Cataglyphis niger]